MNKLERPFSVTNEVRCPTLGIDHWIDAGLSCFASPEDAACAFIAGVHPMEHGEYILVEARLVTTHKDGSEEIGPEHKVRVTARQEIHYTGEVLEDK